MKSKSVKMISAVVVLGVLCGAYVGVKSYVASQEKKEEEAADESVSLVDISSDDITSVSFTADDEEVTLEKSDDTWSKKDEDAFPLSQDTVSSAVSGIISLEADSELKDADELSEYDLDDPKNEITLSTEDGEDTVLRIGMENESTSQYYVQMGDDDEKIYLVDSSSIEPFMGNLYDFAESGTFPTVTSSTITNLKVDMENGYELSEDPDTLYWNISDGDTEEKADTTKATNVTSAVTSLTYDEFVDYNCTDDSEYGFDDPYAVITVDYTEQEEVEEESDEESASEDESSEKEDEETSTDKSTDVSEEDTEETEDDTADSTSADEDSSEEAADTSEEEADDSSSEDSDSDEVTTVTVEKELVIYIGDETGEDRYIKVDDSKEIYTVSTDSLTDILDVSVSDFYSLTVNYLSVQNLDALKIESSEGTHTVKITRTTTTEEAEDDEEAEETTTLSYSLDGQDLDETAFDTFYNKINNMTAQERYMEEYDPEEDPAYTFTLSDVNGNTTVVEYYEYDTNFYAAVVDDKVYLINKMNVKDFETALNEMLNADSEDSSDESSTEETDSDTESDATEETTAESD